MTDPAALPPYPPEQNAYTFSRRPPGHRRRCLPGVAAALVVVLTVAAGATAVLLSDSDSADVIQDDRILSVITEQCDIMTSTVESLVVTGDTDEQVRIVRDQNAAIGSMLAVVRTIDPEVRAADEPTDRWISDWDRLLEARKAYVFALSRGRESSVGIPKDDDGRPVTERMDDAWGSGPAACTVPEALLDPVGQASQPV